MAQAKKTTTKKSASTGKKAAKPKAPTPNEVEAPAPPPPESPAEVMFDLPHRWPGWYRWLAGAVGVILVGAILLAGFDTVYSGKIFPGTSIAGVYVGGLSQAAARSAVATQLSNYEHESLAVDYGTSAIQINLGSLGLDYNVDQSVSLAMEFGRNGSPWHRLYEQGRAIFGRPTNVVSYSYDDSKLTPYLQKIADDSDSPVADAGLTADGTSLQVTASTTGNRLDIGWLTYLINNQLANLDASVITAPVYQISPSVDTSALSQAKTQAEGYLAGPVTLAYKGQTYTISTGDLASWLAVSRPLAPDFSATDNIDDFVAGPPPVSITLDHDKVAAYVAALADKFNVPAQNAALSMQNGQLSVTTPSQTGYSLDQDKTIADILKAIQQPANQRQLSMDITVTQPSVNENNLASLGITDLISEGETYFPGSPADRLINVRAGAAKFNDTLIAPGQTFSLGAGLGEVDASTGYVPELVIIGNHEEYQYGGGLCQVASTMFRAALLAGLPITERANHSFAISYYKWPYAAPGVDATIYYPEVDLKFTNDTGHYILIQTIMNGVDLKFDFYGTKTKVGVIRGPNFISGSNDATQPSKTVFYRDVEDLNGNVIKTDSFYSSYQSSLNFPIISTSKGYN